MPEYQTLSDIKKLDDLIKSFSLLFDAGDGIFFQAGAFPVMSEDDKFELVNLVFGNSDSLAAIYN